MRRSADDGKHWPPLIIPPSTIQDKKPDLVRLYAMVVASWFSCNGLHFFSPLLLPTHLPSLMLFVSAYPHPPLTPHSPSLIRLLLLCLLVNLPSSSPFIFLLLCSLLIFCLLFLLLLVCLSILLRLPLLLLHVCSLSVIFSSFACLSSHPPISPFSSPPSSFFFLLLTQVFPLLLICLFSEVKSG